nr:hypothetical protein CFP56_09394 [Quercus suber]
MLDHMKAAGCHCEYRSCCRLEQRMGEVDHSRRCHRSCCYCCCTGSPCQSRRLALHHDLETGFNTSKISCSLSQESSRTTQRRSYLPPLLKSDSTRNLYGGPSASAVPKLLAVDQDWVRKPKSDCQVLYSSTFPAVETPLGHGAEQQGTLAFQGRIRLATGTARPRHSVLHTMTDGLSARQPLPRRSSHVSVLTVIMRLYERAPTDERPDYGIGADRTWIAVWCAANGQRDNVAAFDGWPRSRMSGDHMSRERKIHIQVLSLLLTNCLNLEPGPCLADRV